MILATKLRQPSDQSIMIDITTLLSEIIINNQYSVLSHWHSIILPFIHL
jgi:hypothetical protein